MLGVGGGGCGGGGGDWGWGFGVLVYWGLTPQQQPGSYQGGEMMMKSVFWWRKPEYPEETTDLRQVTDETFHTYGLCRGCGCGVGGVGAHSYDAFHTRSDMSGVKGIRGMHRFNICLVVVLLWCENAMTVSEEINTDRTKWTE